MNTRNIGFVVMVALAACGKSNRPTEVSTKTHSYDEIVSTYNAVLDKRFDEALTVLTAKLGNPNSISGDTYVWYGLDKKTCYQLKIAETERAMGVTEPRACGV